MAQEASSSRSPRSSVRDAISRRANLSLMECKGSPTLDDAPPACPDPRYTKPRCHGKRVARAGRMSWGLSLSRAVAGAFLFSARGGSVRSFAPRADANRFSRAETTRPPIASRQKGGSNLEIALSTRDRTPNGRRNRRSSFLGPLETAFSLIPRTPATLH